MEKRKSTTTIITLLLLLVFSLPALAVQALTTTQMRENTIRINALEIKNMDITNIEAPKEMTIVLDERALNFDFDKSVVKPEYFTFSYLLAIERKLFSVLLKLLFPIYFSPFLCLYYP